MPKTLAGSCQVRCLHLPRPWRVAFMRGLKLQLRLPVTRGNSWVHPGSFAGVDLESGRARHGEVPELRARCEFASGKVRAVTVTPIYGRGDLLWVRAPRGARRRSLMTLEVLSVGVARVRDMTEADARAEGVGALPLFMRKHGKPVQWFRHFWEEQHGGRAWHRNPWCWVLTVQAHHEQVDKLLKRWEAKS
jgi:hypothetical protein